MVGHRLSGVILALTMMGCGQRLYPVGGMVSFPDGTPVGGAQVIFEPQDPDNKVGVNGVVQADGKYRLGTHQETDGAPPGKYKVIVLPPSPPNPERTPPDWPPFDVKFSRLDLTPLRCEVPCPDNSFNIVVEKTRSP